VGRNARRKKKRREERQRELHEMWSYFKSGRFLGEVQRLIRDAGFNPRSSVGCTKVLKEIGDGLKLSITPVSVEVSIYNSIFTDHIIEHGLNPSDEDMHRLGEAGGRFVTLGSRSQKTEDADKWHGYVVALLKVPNKPDTIIDISIEQATSVADGIICSRPQIFGIPPGFLTGTHVAVGYQPIPNGRNCYVYCAIPDDNGFEQTTDWNRDYGAKAHDQIDFGDMPQVAPESVPQVGQPDGQGSPGPSVITPPESRLLGPDGFPLVMP
jgi:hypothetical protein